MMGRQRRDQGRLFYEFRLEDRIPENHLMRRINVFVTAALADLHKELKPHYSDIGRPSIDPELMIRKLVVAYIMASASSVSCARRSNCTWPIAGFFRRAWFVNSALALLDGNVRPDAFMLLCVLGIG